nr:immunoglobulin heavy chain junction region [Mus musculus]
CARDSNSAMDYW